MENHNIILYVDTENITKKTVEEHSWLGEPRRKGLNKDFTTSVDPGETITWLGLSVSSPNDIVNITSIKHEKGSDLFGRDRLNGDGGYPEQVIGTVKRKPRKEESYTLSFTVYNGNNGGKRKGTFKIDPKLQPHR